MPEATLSASSLATADQALRASEIRYRRLFEAARDGILILDAGSGEITAVNPFLADLLGYSTDDILGKKLWELGPFQDIKKGKIAFKELQSQEYIRYDDLPLETSDGRSIDVEFVSNMYLSDQQQVIQCNIRDITERKRVEQTLARQRSTLPRAVRVRPRRHSHRRLPEPLHRRQPEHVPHARLFPRRVDWAARLGHRCAGGGRAHRSSTSADRSRPPNTTVNGSSGARMDRSFGRTSSRQRCRTVTCWR